MSKKQNAMTTSADSALPTFLQTELENATVTGFENVTTDDKALSILRILQSNSPVLQEDESLRAGVIYDSATGEGHKELVVTPVGFVSCYMEYIPRDQGGGFAGRHSKASGIDLTATPDGNKKFLPNGNELVETAEHMVVVWPEEGNPYLALLPLSSTQIKYSRQWNTDIPRRAPAMYVTKYKLSTGLDKNNKGSWYSLKHIDFVGYVNEEELALTKQAAEEYSKSLQAAESSYAKAPNTAVSTASEKTVDISAHME